MEFAENSSPPLNLAYLAGYLREYGEFECAIEDLRLYSPQDAMSEEQIKAKMRELIQFHAPKIIGITAITQTYVAAKMVADAAKDVSKEIRVVGGGIHATFCAEEMLDDGFDFVVANEGERSLLQLTRTLLRGEGNLESIRGISFRKNGATMSNLPGPPVPIEDIPMPARDLMRMESYIQKGAMITGRGCPYSCYFCACPKIYSKKYTRRSPESVVAEMEHIIKAYGTRDFTFHDDTFCINPHYVEELCRMIKERLGKVSFGCQTRVDTVNERIAEILAGAGCETVQFGVESGNQHVLDMMNKGIRLEQVVSAIRSCAKAGIRFIGCNLMFGHAYDTEDTVLDTIEFGARLINEGATNVGCSVLMPLPGTDPYDKANELGITIYKDPRLSSFGEANISTRNLSREQIKELYAIGIGVFKNRIEQKREERKAKLATQSAS